MHVYAILIFLLMSLVPSESNLNIGLPWNLMLGVLPLFVFQIHFKIPTDCLFLPLFSFLSFLGLFVCFCIYVFSSLFYLGILGYGDHEHSEKGGSLIKAA